MKSLLVLGAALLSIAIPGTTPMAMASSPTQTINVCTQRHLSWVGKEERAIEAQSVEVAKQWQTPTLSFQSGCSGSWTVYLGSDAWITSLGYQTPDSENAGGYHRCAATQCPYAVVGEGLLAYTEMAFDHEILEMTVDPSANGEEVCDPVYTDFNVVNGITLSDWVFPAYFNGGSGPYDFLGVLNGPA